MNFWENWKIKESELNDVVGLEEKDIDHIIALLAMARVLRDGRKLSKAVITQRLLDMAAEDKNIQIIFINMLYDGFVSVIQDMLQEVPTLTSQQSSL